MHLVIAKVTEVLFSGEAVSATLPGSEGQMTILSEHEPLITTLKAGVITVRVEGEANKEFPIEGGVLEVRQDGATVIL
jgi:F-type H+-transporting ATPase subunit epsilon